MPLDYIVAPEARGFLLGAAIANKLNIGCIPNYILEEIVTTKNELDRLNLQLMINMAVINNRLTKGQVRMLKKEYCYN